ncbi:MAG: hypothetical protein M3N22_09365 [Acidobacteriota bacterium]|nr:hypothetical protein [Acidobacteriota bacterium]
MKSLHSVTRAIQKEPHWPAIVAIIADAALYFALPETLSVGPRWLLLAIVLFLLVPITISHWRGHMKLTRFLTLVANLVITLAMVASLVFLIQGLPSHRESSLVLLRSAAGLWLTNILVFALWYWRLDAGGPHARARAAGNLKSAFLFPQMMRSDSDARAEHQDNSTVSNDEADDDDGQVDSNWTPHFLDYLFLAFNTSTAFSPTDTAVLSRGAKLGMMAQSLISLAILVLIAARAVNIL